MDQYKIIPRLSMDAEAIGTILTKRFGESDVVISSTEYEFGDDLRKIDWRATGRNPSGELVVDVTREERLLTVAVVLATHTSMGLYPEETQWLHKPTAIRHALMEIASAIDRQGAIWTYADEHTLFEWKRHGAMRMVQHLMELQYCSQPDSVDRALRALLTQQYSMVPRGSVLYIVTDRLPDNAMLSDLDNYPLDVTFLMPLDGTWETTFPDGSWETTRDDGRTIRPNANGMLIPSADQKTGKVRYNRVANARGEREANEERMLRVRKTLKPHRFDLVVFKVDEPNAVVDMMLAHMNSRRG